jgi:hypothetical protein
VRVRDYLPLTFHITSCAALIGIFLFVSGPMVGRAVWENKVGPVEPNQSIDVYLRGLSGIIHGSQRLSDAFEHLPQHKTLVIFVRQQNPQSEFLGMLIAYLSWPREVQIVNVRNATADHEVAAIKPSSVAGFVFCFMNPPPWLGRGIALGSGLVLVPVSASDVQP